MAINLQKGVVIYVLWHCLVLQNFSIGAISVSVNFNFNASAKDHLRLDGDAKIVSGTAIELTDSDKSLGIDGGNKGSAGRAVYKIPISLYNKSTKAVANFTTSFRFQMKWTPSPEYDEPGDGLAFFMASQISGYNVAYRGDGGWLGLFNAKHNGNLSNHLVAVEFDTYSNSWDPTGDHIGIDVNNITSVASLSLNESLNGGRIWDAVVDYSGQESRLNVSVKSDGSQRYHLSYNINLTEYLPERVVVGLSAGAVLSNETHRVLSWNFSCAISEPSSELSHMTPISEPSPQPSQSTPSSEPSSQPSHKAPRSEPSSQPSHRRKSLTKVILIIICICAVTAILVLFTLVRFVVSCYRKRKRQTCSSSQGDHSDMDADVDMVMDCVPRKFTYEELSSCTNNFSENVKLGKGGFGDVFKGVLLRTNEIVAVKRISEGSKQGKKEYLAEIMTITRLRHRNLVQLLGWCHQKGRLLLVYEYMSNGSLDYLLFKRQKERALDWERRYTIAKDIASALLYLHELWDECVVHRDIKPSNIMLDFNFTAKLGDFGLARLMKHDQWSQTTTVAGTLGYLAPECTVSGVASAESDVFSFGAVALEIACGRPALDLSLEKPKTRLVEWVWELYGKGRLFDAVDSSLKGDFDRAEIEQLMSIGLWCSHPDPFTRPKIRQVLKILNFEDNIPQLPRTMPVASYSPLHEGLMSQTVSVSDCGLPSTTSQEMAVFSSSVSSYTPSTSSKFSASANSSNATSKISESFN